MSTGDVVTPMPTNQVAGSRGNPKRTRRCLFGPVDHAETQKFLEDELRNQQKLDETKWNFDFQSEQPLNGDIKRFEWSPIGDNTVNGTVQSRTKEESANRQTRITDFMKKRKLTSTPKREVHEKMTSQCKDVTT